LGTSPLPQKLFYLGPMFRHERPQAGRLRQFHQFGVELLGVSVPAADVELLSLLWRFFHALRLPGLTLELNTLGETEDRPRYKKVLQDFLETKKSTLCANCQRRLETNPLRVLDCKVPGCREATADAPSIVDHISLRAQEHFAAVQAGLSAVTIPFTLNSRLVRGLDYYTLTTFEVTCTHLGAQNAVGAGGRYDGLVEVLGGSPTPAIGFAVGLERIALLLPEEIVPHLAPSLYVAGFGPEGTRTAYPLLDLLRQAGVEATCDYRATTLKSHLRQADRLHCSHALIIGDHEVSKGMAILRNMVSKEQEDIPLPSLVHDLSTRLVKR
jgi:histidyl-tRNA synthetase